MSDQRYLRRQEASEYLSERWGVPAARNTLAKLAVIGGGPKFYRFGRFPMYSPSDLDTWAESRLSGRAFSSTADAAEAA